MKVLSFYSRLVEMNEQLEKFPNGNENKKLSEEELKTILEFALPNTWHMHMTLSQHIILDKTVKQTLDFLKEIKGLEAKHGSLSIVGVPDEKPKNFPKIKKTDRKRKRDVSFADSESKRQDSKKYCPIHGECSHSAEDCILLKTVISQGKKSY